MNDTQDTVGSSDSFNPGLGSDTFYFHSNDGDLLAYDSTTQKQKLYKNIHEWDLHPDGVCISPNKEMAFSVNTEGQIYQHNLKTDKRQNKINQAAYRGLYICKFTPNGKNFFATNVYGELFEWLYEKDTDQLSQTNGSNYYTYNVESAFKCNCPGCGTAGRFQDDAAPKAHKAPRTTEYANIQDMVITKDSKWMFAGGGDMSLFSVNIEQHKVCRRFDEFDTYEDGNCAYHMQLTPDNKYLWVAWDHNAHDDMGRNDEEEWDHVDFFGKRDRDPYERPKGYKPVTFSKYAVVGGNLTLVKHYYRENYFLTFVVHNDGENLYFIDTAGNLMGFDSKTEKESMMCCGIRKEDWPAPNRTKCSMKMSTDGSDLVIALGKKPIQIWNIKAKKLLKTIKINFSVQGIELVKSKIIPKDIQFCMMCGKHGKFLKLQSCAACKEVRYCSGECQKLDWKRSHKDICKLIRSGSMNVQNVLTQRGRELGIFD